jgi:hypothetical protein
MKKLSDLRFVSFPIKAGADASLTIYEGQKEVPFAIQRMFMVKTVEPCTRGFHAHRECTQLLMALQGECTVTCDDGQTRKEFSLSHPAEGLLIPPTLWAEQTYQAHTILVVLADRPYEEGDYIRNYQNFLEFRREV